MNTIYITHQNEETTVRLRYCNENLYEGKDLAEGLARDCCDVEKEDFKKIRVQEYSVQNKEKWRDVAAKTFEKLNKRQQKNKDRANKNHSNRQ